MSEHECTPERADEILNGALCNYLNQMGDPFEPSAVWEDFCRRGLKRLGEAYETWYRVRRPSFSRPHQPAPETK